MAIFEDTKTIGPCRPQVSINPSTLRLIKKFPEEQCAIFPEYDIKYKKRKIDNRVLKCGIQKIAKSGCSVVLDKFEIPIRKESEL